MKFQINVPLNQLNVKSLICFTLAFTCLNFAIGQNLIANGSFESIKKCPKDLGQFTVKQWSSISRSGTPDLYASCVPKGNVSSPSWEFCQVKPFDGKNFAGIITHFHRETYREYVYTKLSNTLEKDSVYEFSIALSISQLARFKQAYLDVVFTNESLLTFSPKPIIDSLPSITFSLDSLNSGGDWLVYSAQYVADGTERFISIGNFHSKLTNTIEKIPKRSDKTHRKIYNSAYICLDAVTLNKKPLEIHSNSYTLKDIEFENKSFTLDEIEFQELDSLANYLKTNPNRKVLIEGYTDNLGDYKFNKALSLERAKSIAEYLNVKGVEIERISTRAYGSDKPVSTNQTFEGRRINCRISLVFTEL